MRNENFKAHSLDSRSRDYLLTVRIDGLEKKIVWNDWQPLLLDHPNGWTISKQENKIVLSDFSNPDLLARSKDAAFLDEPERYKINLDLPPPMEGLRRTSMPLSIVPLAPLQPPYKEWSDAAPLNPYVPQQLLMYQGVRYFFLKYRPVGKKLTAFAANEKIFAYERAEGGYNVTAFSHDLVVKTKGRKYQIPLGLPYFMSRADFFSSAFIHGINWWRFRSVISPDALPPLEDDESEELLREALRFGRASKSVISLLFFVLFLSMTYNHFYPPKPPAVVTKIELKTPKIIPHKEIVEVKPPPPPPVVVPKPPEPVKEVVKEPVKEPPKKVAKKEPPKKEAPVKPKKIVKKEPPLPAPHAPKIAKTETAPVQKAKNVPPAPGVVAKKMETPPPLDQSVQLAQSLSFLSSGSKNSRKGNLEKYEKTAKKEFMSAPSLGGGSKDSDTLNKLSKVSGDTNIKTKSARSIASDAGISDPKGKGLNDVQGKVSLNELYGSGKGGGFEEGSGLSLSGPGDLSEAAIEKALTKFLARFQFCYEKSLLSDSSLSGNIRLQWTIDTRGTVSSSKVINSQMKNAALHSCILGVLKEIPFPAPKGGSVVAKKTFSFKSSSL